LADGQTFEELLSEFRRVGVDPDTFSAMLALRPEDALRALKTLTDNAGPSAFLAQLRAQGIVPSSHAAATIQKIQEPRRDKSA
jgi:hypothetical protein